MEVIVYLTFDARSKGKFLFRSKVLCPDTFSFEKCIDVLHSLYGSKIIIEFLVV